MKNITRALALLLALVLILGLVVTGFAEDGVTTAGNNGTITISNTKKDQTYTIYEVLYLESYNAAEGQEAYSYKATSAWADYIKNTCTEYFTVDDQGYVTWKIDKAQTDAKAAEFAKKALEYAKQQNLGNSGTSTASADNATVTFNNLSLGYYLLDSSLGTLCSLDTTKPDVTIKEKNAVPTNEKKVQEDSKVGTADEYGTENDADIGQTVNFKSTIKAQAGAQKYVFHDTMSDGLTFDGNVTITKGANAEPVANTSYTLKTKNNADESKKTTDNCTFEIVFNPDFCDTLKNDETIVISYSAMLNEKAVIGSDGTTSNTNKSKLSYGDNSATEWSQTTTKTWKVDVFKFYTDTANAKKGLASAKFTLNKNDTERTAINLIQVGNAASTTYRVATTGETGASTDITTDATGKFTIQGLDSDTYYLTEKEAPKGYNKLKEPIKIVIDENGNVKVNDADTTVAEVGVENKTGAEMPSTGGIGTTVFYVVGGILAVGAAVLLVTKKRMERG